MAIRGYRIEVSNDGSSWSNLVANTNSTATCYSHTGLTAGIARHYRVSAINSPGPASNVATATADATDWAVLVALYNTTGGANWRNNTNWLSDRPLSEWYGVATNATARSLTPNPPVDTDRRREDSRRGVRELQARCSGLEFG